MTITDWEVWEKGRFSRGGASCLFQSQGKSIVLEIPSAGPGLEVRPGMSAGPLEDYRAGQNLLAAGKLEGLSRWKRIADRAEGEHDWRTCWWVHMQTAGALQRYRRWEEMGRAAQKARAFAAGKFAPAEVLSLEQLAISYQYGNRLEDAEAAFRLALQKAGHSNLLRALILDDLGQMLLVQGILDQAEPLLQEARRLREELAAGSALIARSLNHLGRLAIFRGDLKLAEEETGRALALASSQSDNEGMAAGYHNLGIVKGETGELDAAEEYFRKALALRKALDPRSLAYAGSLHNLGMVLDLRGNLAEAERYYREAMAISQAFAPDSLDVAISLTNLGSLAGDRGDLRQAEEYHKKALAIRERLAPGSLDLAYSLSGIGVLNARLQKWSEAESYHRRALEIQSKLAPDSSGVAECLENLGEVSTGTGNLKSAESYYSKALEIYRKIAPGSIGMAHALLYLGNSLSEQGNEIQALQLYRQSLAISKRLAAGSFHEAEVLHAIGLVYRKQKQYPAAAVYLEDAIGALESQVGKIGGGQVVGARFLTNYSDYYRDCIDTLLEIGRPAEAFYILERSRAHIFRSLLSERDLVFKSDIPADLDLERRRLIHEYETIQSGIWESNPEESAAEIREGLNRLHEIRNALSDVKRRILRASPRFSALQYPRPLTLKQTQSLLRDGTAVLSYSVGSRSTLLFMVSSDAFHVASIAVTRDQLEREVEAFRKMLERPQSSPEHEKLLAEASSRLYGRLLAPAEGLIARSKRLLMLPDGPLHMLPFAALGTGGDSRLQYLVERRPLLFSLSATVYEELKRRKRDAFSKTFVGFADPLYPGPKERKAPGSVPWERTTIPALPLTRNEVISIAGLYPDRSSLYLGSRATEEQARAVGPGVRFLHFACHSYLDSRLPLDSGLLLSILHNPGPNAENGILQAWEIFEQVRLNSDMVVLSGCRTGAGEEMGGEGLIGLTRAFQYAGARSVLASLWKIDDKTTSLFMKRFYEALGDGNREDRALQVAQKEFLENKRMNTSFSEDRPPYYWAAFQLYGAAVE